MWDAQQRAQFERLRQKEESGSLNPAEQKQLAAMIKEIEDAEAVSLEPALKRLENEGARVEQQNAALQELIQRKKVLVRRLEQVLGETLREENAIQEELARIFRDPASAPS